MTQAGQQDVNIGKTASESYNLLTNSVASSTIVISAEKVVSNTGVSYSTPTLPLMLSICGVGILIAGIGFLIGMFKGGKKNENK